MRVEVSAGEVLDKLSILTIKMERITDPVKSANVTKEYSILHEEATEAFLNKEVASLFEELYDVNSTLWEIEDKIRLKESQKQFDQEFINLARSVYYTNDRRFEIKKKINAILDSDLVEEKQHIKYQGE